MLAERKNSQLSRFKIGEPLGRGSNSYVYQGYCLKKNVYVAVKVVEKEHSWRTKREILYQKMSKHPSVVELFEWFEDETNMYLILEYCSRGELYSYLKAKKKLDESEANIILLQLASGVEFIHLQKIIHRDLKLGNIFLDDANRVKIGDFGLAKNLSMKANSFCDMFSNKNISNQKNNRKNKNYPVANFCETNINKSSEYVVKVGTPSYLAPESILYGCYTAKSDMWALGCIYYALLTGRLPFEAENTETLYNKILKNKVEYFYDCSNFSNNLISMMFNPDPLTRLSSTQLIRFLTNKDFLYKKVIYPSFSMNALGKVKTKHELNKILSSKLVKTKKVDTSFKIPLTSYSSPPPRLNNLKNFDLPLRFHSPRPNNLQKSISKSHEKNESTIASEEVSQSSALFNIKHQ